MGKLDTSPSEEFGQWLDMSTPSDPGRDQLRQTQKLETLGRLTGGIAHDFNNLLTVIIGNLEKAERFSGADAASAARRNNAIANAMRGAMRAATLSQRLLTFSRRRPLDPTTVDIDRIVKDEVEFLRRALGQTVAIEAVCAAAPWRVTVDESELQAALLNLCVNARDAMPNGGTLVIATDTVVLGPNSDSALPAGRYVTLSVTDTGVGMTQEVMHHAFEPFFTTKSTGHGTGLGLSQVHAFIAQLKGYVKIDSEAGKGTRITIFLPHPIAVVAEEAITPAAEAYSKEWANQPLSCDALGVAKGPEM